jgi:UDP-2,3-diacylglucosamine hydrolase
MASTRNIGIIAGNGVYPSTFARAARAQSTPVKLSVAAFENETDAALLTPLVDSLEWLRVGQLGKLIKYFKSQGVTEAIMVGQIAPKNLFDLRPDLRLLFMLAKVKERNAESLFGAIADELQKDGITLLPATTFMEDLLAPAGHIFGPTLKSRAWDDVHFGQRIAKESSRLDIGQTVIVRHGTVLAVEAFEGTNACIKRGGELGRGKAVTMVKVSKPNQDFRFDIPVIGAQTILTCADAGVGVIAVESGKTLMLEKDRIAELCKEKQITLVGFA